MDERLDRKVDPIERWANDMGWETQRNYGVFDGADGVQLVGVRTDQHPDYPEVRLDWGFSVAFAANPDTGRVGALRFDGKTAAVFVVTVEDGTGRYWYGPLSAHKRALEDPAEWTGVSVPEPADGWRVSR